MIHPRPELEAVATVPHGSTHRPDVADFSSSVIPLDLPLPELFARTQVFRYPDTTSRTFRGTVARALGVAPEMVVAGNGASEIFFMVALGFLNGETRVGLLRPTFGEYERVARIMGAPVHSFELDATEEFRLELPKLSRWLAENEISVLFLCNPNNPTGRSVGFESLADLARAHPDRLLVVDLAYVDYLGITLPYPQLLSCPNVLLVHSLTKAFGIAGLRSGFAVARPEIIAVLEKVRIPWNMNAVSQDVSTWLVANREKYAPVVAAYRKYAQDLSNTLRNAGFRTFPSDTDYFMVEVIDALIAREDLLREGFLVRELASLGCPRHIRVNVCEPELNTRFANAFRRVIPRPE